MEKKYDPDRPTGWLDIPCFVTEPQAPPGLVLGGLGEGRDTVAKQADRPHKARLLADSEGFENKRKPQLFGVQHPSVTLYAYPIVTLDELRGGVVVDRENQEFMRGRETDVCDRKPGRNDFAIRTLDDSMNGGPHPIPAGTVVFIEATNEAAPGEIVLIQIAKGTPILRTLVDVGDGYQLLPSASGMQATAMPSNIRLFGVAFSWNVRARPVSGGRKPLAANADYDKGG